MVIVYITVVMKYAKGVGHRHCKMLLNEFCNKIHPNMYALIITIIM
jgi:hypothetical protein